MKWLMQHFNHTSKGFSLPMEEVYGLGLPYAPPAAHESLKSQRLQCRGERPVRTGYANISSGSGRAIRLRSRCGEALGNAGQTLENMHFEHMGQCY